MSKFLDENGLLYLWGKVKTMLEGKQDSATAVTMEQVTQAIAEAAIQTQDVYSTEEQVVGRWIDGKPLYKRTFMLQTPPKNIEQAIFTLENAEFKEISGYFVSSSGGIMPLHFYGAPDSYSVAYSKDSTIYFIVSHENYQNRPLVLTGIYTKTTDQATIELPAMPAITQPVYSAAPQTAASGEIRTEIWNKEV